jgi:hypothetical protein
MTITRAISIRQPFAEAILRGLKKAEFRSVRTKIRERVWIYASLKDRDDEFAAPYWRKLKKEPGDLPKGVVVGSVEIVGCSPHPIEKYAYRLANPKRMRPRKPIGQPCPVFWRPKGMK